MKINQFFIVLISLFLLFSCVTTNNDGADATPEPEQDAKTRNELVIALGPSMPNFDPVHAFTSIEAQFYTALYEGLVTYNPVNLSPEPALASRWEKSADKMQYTFYLRENLYYNNGDKVTAGDIRSSWFRLLSPTSNAAYSVYFDIIKGARAYRTGETDDRESVGIRTEGDRILKVELEKPAIHFLHLLCHMSFVAIHPHYIENEKELLTDTSLISNGPYYLFSRDKNEMVFKKNNLYWNSEDVKIETIRVLLADEREEFTRKFNNFGIPWSMYWDMDLIDNNSYLLVYPMFSTSYYFFNCRTAPWNDPKVRRGLAVLVPWDTMRKEYFYFGTDKLVPRLSEDYPDVKGISEAKVDEGLDLLREAGFPKGEGLPELVIKLPADSASKEIIRIATDAWKEHLNLSVKVVEVPGEIYFDSLKQNDYTIGTTTWIGDFADPLTFLELWTSYSNLNEAHYNNEEYDRLIEGSYKEEDKIKRYEMLAQAETLLLTSAVVIPQKNNPAVNLVNTDIIEGWVPNLLDIHPFRYIRFKESTVYPNIVLGKRNNLRGFTFN